MPSANGVVGPVESRLHHIPQYAPTSLVSACMSCGNFGTMPDAMTYPRITPGLLYAVWYGQPRLQPYRTEHSPDA